VLEAQILVCKNLTISLVAVKEDLNYVIKCIVMQKVFAMTSEEWLPVVIDYLYLGEEKNEDVFAHAKIISKTDSESDDYYELMIPSHDYFVCYIVKKKIKRFL
jgi:hypothetical protein